MQTSFLFEQPAALPVATLPNIVLHDAACRAATAENPNMLVPWILSAAYAYSVLDRPIISDGLYDQLSIDLAGLWDRVRHFHKPILQRNWFPKGSTPLVAADFPARVVGATERLLGDGASA